MVRDGWKHAQHTRARKSGKIPDRQRVTFGKEDLSKLTSDDMLMLDL
jgi:hypothetical protein